MNVLLYLAGTWYKHVCTYLIYTLAGQQDATGFIASRVRIKKDVTSLESFFFFFYFIYTLSVSE